MKTEKEKNIVNSILKLEEDINLLISSEFMLHNIMGKIINRGYQSFDKSDIMSELGAIQKNVMSLHSDMLNIEKAVKEMEKGD